MKKKFIYKTLFLATALSLGLTSCDSDEVYDFPGNSGALYVRSQTSTQVNALHNAFSSTLTKNPVGLFGNVKMEFPISATVPAPETLGASFKVDNTLIEEYNNEHGTEYAMIPEDYLAFTNNKLTINSGNYTSADSVKISMDMEKAKQLEGNKDYLVPFVMTKTAGSLPVSEEWNAVYLHVRINEDTDNIWDDATENDVQGKFVEDRSNWNIYTTATDVTQTGKVSDVFDENISSSLSITSAHELPVIVDLSKTYTIGGIYTNYYNWRSAIDAQQEIFVSVDGEKWESVGTTTRGDKTIVFYQPLEVRYIKWTIPVKHTWSGNKASLTISEFNVYAK